MHRQTILALVAACCASVSSINAAPHVDTSISAPGALGRRHFANAERRVALTSSEPASQQRRVKRSGKKGKRTCKSKTTTASTANQSAQSKWGSTTSRVASNSSSSSSSSSTSSTTSSNSSVSSVDVGNLNLGSGFMQRNGIYWGWLPDEADAGGSRQTMAQINSWMGKKSAFYGWYAQAQSGKTFTGSQLTSEMSDIKASGAIFIASVMPTGGWAGLTTSDNSQAVNIANVMKKFTDEGIEVWLRFAHEMNWYLTDGTYKGSKSDFLTAWGVVSAAIDKIAPKVKMYYSPNVASLSVYTEFYPTSGRVDIIGVDYYPSKIGSFVSTMKGFHDKYCKAGGPYFVIGETGLAQSASVADRAAWADEMTSAATAKALPYYIGTSWFNFVKGYDFRLADGTSATTSAVKALFG